MPLGGTRGPKDNYFQRDDMLYIKLKGGKSRITCREIYASGRDQEPQRQLFSERSYTVAYQIEGMGK